MIVWHALRHAALVACNVFRARTAAHQRLRQRLLAAFFFSIIVDAIGSPMMYVAEHTASGTQIHTIGETIFWVTTQLLTISSQMANPVTAAGRVIDVALQLYAITVVTAMAGSFGSFFHRHGGDSYEQPDPPSPA